MSAELSFRRATPADIERLLTHVHSAYRGDPSRKGWTTEADLLDGQRPEGSPRRFTSEELSVLLVGAGFADVALHAVRVFSDLVPSSLVDLEPGAGAALAALEEAVAGRPEYLALATQVHALATLS